MPRTIKPLLAMATLFAAAPLLAQSVNFADPSNTDSTPGSAEISSQPPAPIERGYADSGQQYAPSPQHYQPPQNHTSQPAQGIWLVTAPHAAVQTVSAAAGQIELRVEHGLANVNVDHPADNSEITVDLPGGQVSLVKDGLYTFNADTNTVRVLRGEAVIASGNNQDKDHQIKVKEDRQFTFGNARTLEADPNQLRADLLQGNYGQGGYGESRHGDGEGYRSGFYGYPYGYGYSPYGFYGSGWGYPGYAFSPWGYPYGYGFGLGFGSYRGFGYRGGFGGGFRGGYRGGFRR